LEPGSYQGFLRIEKKRDRQSRSDNIRYFTVDVRHLWKILIAAPSPANDKLCI